MAILWYCIKPEAQILLWTYQWENYGTKLTIPPDDSDDWQPIRYGMMLESTEELAMLMRQKPKYRGSIWRG